MNMPGKTPAKAAQNVDEGIYKGIPRLVPIDPSITSVTGPVTVAVKDLYHSSPPLLPIAHAHRVMVHRRVIADKGLDQWCGETFSKLEPFWRRFKDGGVADTHTYRWMLGELLTLLDIYQHALLPLGETPELTWIQEVAIPALNEKVALLREIREHRAKPWPRHPVVNPMTGTGVWLQTR